MNITREIGDLKRMGMNDLRARYAKVFGETTRTGNRSFLIKRILWRLQSMSEGTLSERASKRAEELADEFYLRTSVPRLAYASGVDLVFDAPGTVTLPRPGTVITRQYKGRMLQVTVLSNGFDYDGQVYRTLSAVAKAVTGSHWNGNLFFGLTQKRAKQ